MDISLFLNSRKEWVNQNEDIKALILVGSYAIGKVASQNKSGGKVTSIRVWYNSPIWIGKPLDELFNSWYIL